MGTNTGINPGTNTGITMGINTGTTTEGGKQCIFPFTYYDEEHMDCLLGSVGKSWCPTSANKDADGYFTEWDYCL